MGIRNLVKKWIRVQNKESAISDVTVLEKSENVFFETEQEISRPTEYDAFYDMIDQETELTGTVLLSQYDEEFGNDILKLVVNGMPVFIVREDLAFKKQQLPLAHYVGETIYFQLIEVNENCASSPSLDAFCASFSLNTTESLISSAMELSSFSRINSVPSEYLATMSTMSIPRPAPARWNSASTPAKAGAGWQRRIRSVQSPAFRSR